MSMLLRAIVTGLGLKIGSEIGKYITEKVRKLTDPESSESNPDEDPKANAPDDDDLPGTSPEPPTI